MARPALPKPVSPDPALDSLFRPTAVDAAIADRALLLSAPPRRQPGTHTRAGNAMDRTRAAVLDGARRAVAAHGTKITMAQVAAAAGVAKATLYNHFRTREAVLHALLEADVRAIVEATADQPLPDALTSAAGLVAAHPALRCLARLETATLARIAHVDPRARGWAVARDGLDGALARAHRDGTDTVLRWLAGFVVNPAGATAIAADVDVLFAGLPARAATAAETA